MSSLIPVLLFVAGLALGAAAVGLWVRARLAVERRHADEKLALMQEAKEQLSDRFRRLAQEILDEKSERFTDANRAQLGQLLDPLRQRLGEFQTRIERYYDAEGQGRAQLVQQVRQLAELNQTLSADAQSLTEALKGSSQVQGAWGEVVLERLLEAAGLARDRHYRVQPSFTRADGTRGRPDVIVDLPEGRSLVIDAKVSLTAYEAMARADDEAERARHLEAHLVSVRSHVKQLAERRYAELPGVRSPDFVLMFVAVEPAFLVALGAERDLILEASRANVLLVSPSTLLFALRTVAHLWRQEDQSRNAQAIAEQGAKLYDKLASFVESLESVGRRLDQAREAYDTAHKRLATGRGNAIVQAEQLTTLGVQPAKRLPAELVDLASEPAPERLAPETVAEAERVRSLRG